MICGLILAAGKSQRMGQPKLFLPLGETGEKCLIERVLAAVNKSKIDRAYLVVRPEDEFLPSLAQAYNVEIVVNPEPERGMLSSIITGINNLPKEAEAVIIFLGDQPGISSSVVDLLIVGYRLKEKGIVLPVFQGKRGHPVLIDLKYRQEIETCPPEIGLRFLIHQHSEDILEIPVNEPGILYDIDTPEDYYRFFELSKTRKD